MCIDQQQQQQPRGRRKSSIWDFWETASSSSRRSTKDFSSRDNSPSCRDNCSPNRDVSPEDILQRGALFFKQKTHQWKLLSLLILDIIQYIYLYIFIYISLFLFSFFSMSTKTDTTTTNHTTTNYQKRFIIDVCFPWCVYIYYYT